MRHHTARNKKIYLEALEQSLGVITTACKSTGVPRATVYKWFKQDTRFVKQVDDITEISKDFVESKLLNQIKKENLTAIIFYLKTKAKDRGYIETANVNISNIEVGLPEDMR